MWAGNENSEIRPPWPSAFEADAEPVQLLRGLSGRSALAGAPFNTWPFTTSRSPGSSHYRRRLLAHGSTGSNTATAGRDAATVTGSKTLCVSTAMTIDLATSVSSPGLSTTPVMIVIVPSPRAGCAAPFAPPGQRRYPDALPLSAGNVSDSSGPPTVGWISRRNHSVANGTRSGQRFRLPRRRHRGATRRLRPARLSIEPDLAEPRARAGRRQDRCCIITLREGQIEGHPVP